MRKKVRGCLTYSQADLTTLRRNVALGFYRFPIRKPGGKLGEHRERRPHWASHQQRLVSPAEVDFIDSNPLDLAALRKVLARMLGNYAAAEIELPCLEAKLRPYADGLTEEQCPELLDIIDQVAVAVEDLLERDMPNLILARADMAVLITELAKRISGRHGPLHDEAWDGIRDLSLRDAGLG